MDFTSFPFIKSNTSCKAISVSLEFLFRIKAIASVAKGVILGFIFLYLKTFNSLSFNFLVKIAIFAVSFKSAFKTSVSDFGTKCNWASY